MRRMLCSFAALLLAFAFAVPAHAETTLSSGPTGATDITAETFGDEEFPTGNSVFAFDVSTVDETEQTYIFDVDECPVLALSLGGYMTTDSNWSCDEDALQVTMNVNFTGLVPGAFGNEDGEEGGEDSVLMLALTDAAEVEGQGPGESESGMFMSTNVNQWEMTPPSPENIAFGFSLTGPEGADGYFRMFMPQGTIDNLSNLAGEELTAADLAVFNDGEQASLDVEEVDGGAMIEINVTFTEAVTSVDDFETASFGATSTNSGGTVTKTITAGEQLPISLSATKASVKKGKNSYLYGWVKDAEKGDKVTVLRATKKSKVKKYKKCKEKFQDGDDKGKCKVRKKKYRRVKVKNNEGYYRFPMKMGKKNLWWQTSAIVDGERVKSEKVQITRKAKNKKKK